MKAPDCIFRLDRHTRFLQGQAKSCRQIVPRVIGADQPLSGRDSHLQRLPGSITRATISRAKTLRRLEAF